MLRGLKAIKHLLSNFCRVSSRQNVQVRQQCTGLQHSLVPGLEFFTTKGDVILDCGILDPGLLGHVGHRALMGNNDKKVESQYLRDYTSRQTNHTEN